MIRVRTFGRQAPTRLLTVVASNNTSLAALSIYGSLSPMPGDSETTTTNIGSAQIISIVAERTDSEYGSVSLSASGINCSISPSGGNLNGQGDSITFTVSSFQGSNFTVTFSYQDS